MIPDSLNGSGVYLVRCDDLYKIGQTTDIRLRLATLQTGNPYLLEVSLFIPCEFPEFNSLERALHKRFANQNIRREWFKLDMYDLKVVMKMGQRYANKPMIFGPIAEEWKMPKRKGRS